MSKGISNLFKGTLGTTFHHSNQKLSSFSERGLDIPENIKDLISVLAKKGDFIAGSYDSFSMKDISILSKETGVEYAKITIENSSFLIRGDTNGTYIPESLFKALLDKKGSLDFHSHPYDDDCVPSESDIKMMSLIRKHTGRTSSKIVTPNGKIVTYSDQGIISIETISNSIDEKAKLIYLELFGGN